MSGFATEEDYQAAMVVLEAERDRYRIALQEIEAQGAEFVPGRPWRHWREIAREALNAWK